jgi:TctA family transporter
MNENTEWILVSYAGSAAAVGFIVLLSLFITWGLGYKLDVAIRPAIIFWIALTLLFGTFMSIVGPNEGKAC